MKTLTISDLKFELIPEYDYMPMKGNLIDSGDSEFDNKTILEVTADVNNGNIWGWCTVEMKASYKGLLTASDYLGGCSYASEKEFIEGGYYEQMQDNCLDEIQRQLNELTV